jgi:hypothetical protein
MKNKLENNTVEYEECIIRIQKHLEDCPLIILGSGASIPYGLPSMNDVSTEILTRINGYDSKEFTFLLKHLSKMNLEEAINASDLSKESQNIIREIVWKYLCENDIKFFNKIIQGNTIFPICKLLDKVLQPAQNSVSVITTNYDRIVEYASDTIGATTITGFEGSLIKKFEFPSEKLNKQRVIARERTVFIWKVHGSLDWFMQQDKNIVCYPLSTHIPINHIPLIIPPGKDKYGTTHIEPYRSVINRADDAIINATSYLCIGYGFNDEHIQPKLLDEIAKGKPIVILAQKATPSRIKYINKTSIKKFIIIEEYNDNKTSVSGNDWSAVYDGNFWNLEQFMKIW